MGPQNGLPPDTGDFGTGLPTTDRPEPDLSAERNMAKFSQTKEFQRLKEIMESRIGFWTQYAPGSNQNPVAYRDLSNDERGWRGLVADVLIEEFNGIINAYELAGKVVNDADEKKDNRKK